MACDPADPGCGGGGQPVGPPVVAGGGQGDGEPAVRGQRRERGCDRRVAGRADCDGADCRVATGPARGGAGPRGGAAARIAPPARRARNPPPVKPLLTRAPTGGCGRSGAAVFAYWI